MSQNFDPIDGTPYENPRDGNMPKAPTFSEAVVSAAKRNKKKLVVGVIVLVAVLVVIFNH